MLLLQYCIAPQGGGAAFCFVVHTELPCCSPCLMLRRHPKGWTLTMTLSNELVLVELSTSYCSYMISERGAVETWLCIVDVEYCGIKLPCGNPHFSVCRLSELTANPACLSATPSHVTRTVAALSCTSSSIKGHALTNRETMHGLRLL